MIPADSGSTGDRAEDAPGQRDGTPDPRIQQTAREPREGIDEAVAALDVLVDLPLSEHVERFEVVHTELTAALSSIDKV